MTASCFLYQDARARPTSLDGLPVRPLEALAQDAAACESACVLIADQSVMAQPALIEGLPEHVVVVAGDTAAEAQLGHAAAVSIAFISDERARASVLRAACQLSVARLSQARMAKEAEQHEMNLAELNRIGTALMTERNPDALLRQILMHAMQCTGSDAGALFMVEEDEDGVEYLQFRLVCAPSRHTNSFYTEERFPVDSTSVTGHATLTKEVIVLEDIRNLPPGAAFSINPLPERHDYWIKPMMAIPMINHRDKVVGILQLANRKCAPDVHIVTKEDAYDYTVAYSARDVQIGRSLAGQAGILIENARLYEQIDDLFACFVKSAVTAIDQRDPTTAGHSVRVATLVTDLAVAVGRSDRGTYRDVYFSAAQIRELRYAALLHDFGKIGVREEVLVKARKLPLLLEERLHARFDLIESALQLQYERNRARAQKRGIDHPETRRALNAKLTEELAELKRFRSVIAMANEPTLLPHGATNELLDVARRTFQHPDGRVTPYLESEELHFLQIPRGSLDEDERREVEAHARQTFEFLSGIPWTESLQNVATIASSHHERLDGSGYPNRLRERSVSLPIRMLSIADMFDALTASDRPYKRAFSVPCALDIIQAEVSAGRLDAEVFSVFLESGVYHRILEHDWHTL